MVSFSIAQMADTLSLSVSSDADRLRVERHDADVTASPNPLALLDLSEVRGRHVAFCILTAARLGLDRVCSDFEPGRRDSEPSRPLRYHEKPSIYGERLPRLLPGMAVAWLEAICDAEAFVSDWVLPEFQQVYVLETGRHLHTLATDDVALMTESPEKIRRNGRHALFYESYKLKPREKKRYSGGLVRIFRTVEGLGASRAVLLPDFDYDAAREGGSFAIPSRDTMIVGRPEEPENADAIADHVQQLASAELDEALFPLCNRVWRLTDKVVAGSTGFGDTTLPFSGWDSPDAFDIETTHASN